MSQRGLVNNCIAHIPEDFFKIVSCLCSNYRESLESCGSICTAMPSTLTAFFVSRVMTWSFFLKLYSAVVFPFMLTRIAFSTSFALSTLTVLCACTPVEMLRRLVSEVKGLISQRYLRILWISFQSQACLALVISLFCSPVL